MPVSKMNQINQLGQKNNNVVSLDKIVCSELHYVLRLSLNNPLCENKNILLYVVAQECANKLNRMKAPECMLLTMDGSCLMKYNWLCILL